MNARDVERNLLEERNPLEGLHVERNPLEGLHVERNHLEGLLDFQTSQKKRSGINPNSVLKW